MIEDSPQQSSNTARSHTLSIYNAIPGIALKEHDGSESGLCTLRPITTIQGGLFHWIKIWFLESIHSAYYFDEKTLKSWYQWTQRARSYEGNP